MTARRSLAAWIAGLTLAAALPAAGAELPTADQVFARHRAAIGGDAVDKVRNAAFEFDFSLPSMGVTTTGKAYQVFPDKAWMTIELASLGVPNHEEGFVDGIAWRNSPQTGLQKLEGLERRMVLQRARLDGFTGWKELWKKAETVATEPVEGEPCYKVVLTPDEGTPVSSWFSTKTGLLVEMEVPAPQMSTVVSVKLGDYRPVGGITLAHRIEQSGPMSIVLEYTRIRFDVDDIPPGRFALPAGLAPAAPASR